MKVLKAVPRVGEMVTLIMTKESKEATKNQCGLVSDMFPKKRMRVKNVSDNDVILEDGYSYSFRSIKTVKNRVIYEGELNSEYSYSGLPGSGIIQVGCQRIKVTDELIKDLKAIQKPKVKGKKVK